MRARARIPSWNPGRIQFVNPLLSPPPPPPLQGKEVNKPPSRPKLTILPRARIGSESRLLTQRP